MDTLTKTQIKQRITGFHEDTLAFYNKESTVAAYKRKSGGFGTYAQRGAERAMVRFRIPAGRLHAKDFAFFASLCETYPITHLHLTTDQNIQFHGVKPKDVSSLLLAGSDYGLYNFGSGANYPRNVLASPLTGLSFDDYFDVTPFAQAMTKYAFSLFPDVNFPRKLKSAISSNAGNEVHVHTRDLGFQAKPNGCFDVYVCGGLGRDAATGLLAYEDIDPNEVLYYFAGFIDFFKAYGDYTNHMRARSRYIRKDMGDEALLVALNTCISKRKQDASLLLHESVLVHPDLHPRSEVSPHLYMMRNGTYAYHIRPNNGDLSVTDVLALSTLLQQHPHLGVALTPFQSFYIIHATLDDIHAIQQVAQHNSQTAFEASLACVGATICQIGLQDSSGMLATLLDHFNTRDTSFLPKIHMSGCINSCAAHQNAAIGFAGTARVVENKAVPAYEVHVLADRKAHRLASNVGVMLASELLPFFDELYEVLDAPFHQWIKHHKSQFDRLLAKHLFQAPPIKQ
ncbi:MAG: hypothetical protein ACRCZJ_06885 [Erysipelotrichaceae bacterium]